MERRQFIKSTAAASIIGMVDGGAPGFGSSFFDVTYENLPLWRGFNLKDNLEIWKEKKWGWAMWCFRGSFGVADSGRKDVKYENYRGLKLDRKMVELLKSYQ